MIGDDLTIWDSLTLSKRPCATPPPPLSSSSPPPLSSLSVYLSRPLIAGCAISCSIVFNTAPVRPTFYLSISSLSSHPSSLHPLTIPPPAPSPPPSKFLDLQQNSPFSSSRCCLTPDRPKILQGDKFDLIGRRYYG